MNTRAFGEDGYGANRRGEGTSRIETRLDSAAEAMAKTELHAEDNPQLVGMIKSAEAAEAAAAEEVEKEWLAAKADGTVARMQGEVDVAKIVPQATDNEIEALRKLRLAQMKGRAVERQSWLSRGHGTYEKLEQESSFLEALPKHERAVCTLAAHGSLDGEMLHTHMRALCRVHVETYFCWLDPETAPVMMGMVDIGRLPALLLCKAGKVVHTLHGLDRSFTTEGIGYELGQQQMVDFEEGMHYASVKVGCTTATAGRVGARVGHGVQSDDESDDADLSD